MSDHLADPYELAARLGPATRHLVILDFDGTLSPIVDHPDDADLQDGAFDAVRRLADVTAVAIVSGRPVEELRPRFGELPLALAGGHGAVVVHADGRREDLVDVPAVAVTLDRLEEQVRVLVDDEPGWFVERKDASLAVHHRLAPSESVDALLPRVRAVLGAQADEPPGFRLVDGKAVVEVRPAVVDKGRAVHRLADGPGDRTPLVLGDDVTDEDAFRAAHELGGVAVLVADEARDTAATARLADPAAVVHFLATLAVTEG